MTSAYQPKLPIWTTLGAAYRKWWRTLPALRPLVINAILIVPAISVLDERYARTCCGHPRLECCSKCSRGWPEQVRP
jgi:hypothetical protein